MALNKCIIFQTSLSDDDHHDDNDDIDDDGDDDEETWNENIISDYSLRRLCEISWEQKTCTRFWATEKAFLQQCKWVKLLAMQVC